MPASVSTPSRPAADRNLLFGILAFQMDFISRDALIQAMNAWILDKPKPLGQIVVEHCALRPERRELLETLVDAHLDMHGDDAERSLAAVTAIGSVRNDLEQIADPDVQASLVQISRARPAEEDSWPTRQPSAGTPTSTGLRTGRLRRRAALLCHALHPGR
jgi:hypothetical protein